MNNPLEQKISLFGLIKFTLPTILMMIFMSFYTMVDGLFVSNFVSTNALSAVNIVYPILSVVIGISIMLATGGSAIVAKMMGEGKERKAKATFSMLVYIGIFIGVITIFLGIIFLEPILRFLGANDTVFKLCYDYAFIIMWFVPLAILQMLFQYFFVAAGKPTTGLIVTFISGVTNIVLDYIFIVKIEMGIKGAALATGMGFSISALFGLVYFTVNRKGTLYLVKTKFDFNVIRKACANGSSEMVTNISVGVTTLLFNITMMKYLGENGVAAITIVLYAEYLFNAIFLGYSSGVAPLYSYNYGVKDVQKTKKLFSYSILFIGITSVVIFILVNILSDDIVGLFAKGNREVFEIAINGMNLFALGFLFMGSNIFTSSLFTALSNGKVSAGLSFVRTFLLISSMILILPLILGVNGVWLAVPVAEIITLIISVVCIVKLKDTYLYL